MQCSAGRSVGRSYQLSRTHRAGVNLNDGNEAKRHLTDHRHWRSATRLSASVPACLFFYLPVCLSLSLCSDRWGVQSTRDTSLISDWSTPPAGALHSASRQNGRRLAEQEWYPPVYHAVCYHGHLLVVGYPSCIGVWSWGRLAVRQWPARCQNGRSTLIRAVVRGLTDSNPPLEVGCFYRMKPIVFLKGKLFTALCCFYLHFL